MRSGQASRQGFWCSTTGNNPPLTLGRVVLQRVVELVLRAPQYPPTRPSNGMEADASADQELRGFLKNVDDHEISIASKICPREWRVR